MNLLLDTHALLWWLGGRAMAAEAMVAIAEPENNVAVSAASIWEAAIKQSLGKLSLPDSLADAAVDAGFDSLAITGPHAEAAGALPPHHRDPFDRMLVAQASIEDLVIVTRNAAFAPYGVRVLAC